MKNDIKRIGPLGTAILLLMAALMTVPAATANHADCGDPVQEGAGYAGCRGKDAVDHCNEAGGTCEQPRIIVEFVVETALAAVGIVVDYVNDVVDDFCKPGTPCIGPLPS